MDTSNLSDGPATVWHTAASIATRPTDPHPPSPIIHPLGPDTSLSSTLAFKVHAVQALFGDCFVIEFKANGKRNVWLVDGGPGGNNMPFHSKDSNTGSVVRCLFESLNSLNVDKLDLMIVTHRDYDHLHGILLLLVRVPSLNRDLSEKFLTMNRHL